LRKVIIMTGQWLVFARRLYVPGMSINGATKTAVLLADE
jgi:hypothetical protein